MSRDREQSPELSPLKRALFAVKDLRARLEAAERARVEPIAIVGMACRFPGARDLESYWRLLEQGVDAIREVPPGRWDIERFYDPDPDAPGKTYSREGGFLEEVDGFDAGFFGIPPREVVSMDPQQRLLLEVTWEAIENAGIAADVLAGTSTGVYVGMGTNDYAQLTIQNDDPTQIDAYMGTGGASCVAAGRISYILGLHGPSLAIDTACSSSLVAVDLAVHQLRAGRCGVALAGGVNLILSPVATVYLSRVRALSATSRCKAFDASADGYVRGEGCGMVVLKRLSDALRDGDVVRAVIRGSAANHDGRSSGLTVPNGQAQQAVIRQALEDGGIAPSEIDYIEAHGTGTPLGDPIEVRALSSVLGQARPKDTPVIVGTVKTNIGHLEAAAGVAGLIKVVLAMEHRRIPASLHFRSPNPHLPWAELPVTVPAGPMPWPERGRPPLSGVSAFGFSGTNAHVVVEAAPARSDEPAPGAPAIADRARHVLALSATSPAALRDLAARYRDACAGGSAPAADIAFSANTGRSAFDHRLAVIGATPEEFARGLDAYVSGRDDQSVATGQASMERPRVAFLFTGQGSQYAGMGRELYEHEPIVRETLDRCDAILRDLLPRPLLSVMYPTSDADAALIDQTAYTQPALFAVEYAIARLWMSWGIEPAFVMGHSVGEYVAACIAGLFSLEDGLRLIAERARLMQTLPSGGRMAAVFADEGTVADAIRPHAGRLSIAAINGPANVVVSGEGTDVEAVLARMSEKGIRSQALVVSHAFHSPLMNPIAGAFERAAASVTWNAPRVRIVSNLTGDIASPAELGTPAYWKRHLREPVRFAQSVATLASQGCTCLLEVGPAPTLLGMAARCLPPDGVLALPSLRKGAKEPQQILKTLSTLYVNGAAVDWSAFDRGRRRRRVALPTYPFQRSRYWIKLSEGRRQAVADSEDAAGHPLLGRRVRSPLLEATVFEVRVPSEAFAFVNDHAVYGTPVFPATGYIEMATAGAARAFGATGVTLEDLVIEEALAMPADAPRMVQIAFAPLEDGRSSFQVFSRAAQAGDPDARWTRHAAGRVAVGGGATAGAPISMPELRQRFETAVDRSEFYSRLARGGVEHGPVFQGIDELWRGEGEALARLRVPDALTVDAGAFGIHPAFLDAALQVLGAAVPAALEAGDAVYLPVGIASLRQHAAPGSVVWSHARVQSAETPRPEALTADLRWYADDGRLVWEANGVTMKRASSAALRRISDRQIGEWLYEVEWQSTETPAPAALPARRWLILADQRGEGAALARRLESAGVSCVMADAPEHARLAEIVATACAGGPLSGVVHLWSLDADAPATTASTLDTMSERTCGSVLTLVQGLSAAKLAEPPRLWLVTRGAVAAGVAPWPVQVAQAPVWGLARVIAVEQPQWRCTAVDLDPGEPHGTEQLLAEMSAGSDENQVAFRGGARHVARFVRRGRAHSADRRLPVPAGESFQLTTTSRGVLDNLVIEARPRPVPGPDEVEVRVHAAGLNFRDVLNALGMYPGDPGPMGGECAGRVVSVGAGVRNLKAGDDVLCLAGASFSKYIVTPAQAAVRLPDHLSYEQGASIPVTFLTAHYGLHHLARIEKGDRVLVHAAAGGVGQAAVQLALRAGAEVYGTAGSTEKREFVRALGVREVFSSRTADFPQRLLELTGGHGVDIVLNSLTGPFIPESLRVLAPGGHFLEIGKAEIWTAEAVAGVNPHVTYRPFDLSDAMLHDIAHIERMFADVMQGLSDGSLRTLPIRVFDLQDAMAAFRFMAQARHVGKIVLTQRALVAGEAPAGGFDPDATYLITGGSGGLGLQVAEWMVGGGVRHLVLTSRSAPSSTAAAAIDVLRTAGADVRVATGDVSQEPDVRRILDEITASRHPLRGVIHAAGVLDDGLVTDQTWPQFQKVLAPKMRGSWLLHQLTEHERLDFFVLFSSTSSVLGAAGQSNYAAANAFMDGLAHHRRASGRPALSISWGAWSEVGMAARLQARDQSRIADRGVTAITPAQGVRVLGQLLHDTLPHVAVLPVRWSTLLRSQGGVVPPILRVVAREAAGREDGKGDVAMVNALKSRLDAVPEAEQADLILGFVKAQVARVLGLESGDALEVHAPFTSLGLDSLMAVELRNALAAAMGRTLPASLTFDHPTIERLASFMGAELLERPAAAKPPDDGAGDTARWEKVSEQLDALSDDQMAALLASQLAALGSNEGRE